MSFKIKKAPECGFDVLEGGPGRYQLWLRRLNPISSKLNALHANV
jgi:hypothetical protein